VKKSASTWDQVDALRAVEDAVPAGAFTVYDYMSRYGVVSRLTAFDQLGRLVRTGKMKTGKRIESSSGRHQQMRFYWSV
jgi:hypothetical protein